MNAALLLEHYARIADAPDAIARLRRFVLDLAVRGKLVDQDGPRRTLPIEDCLEELPDGRFIHQGWSPQCETISSTDPMVWGVLKTTAVQDGFFLPEQNKQLPSTLEAKEKLEVQPGDILITCAGPRARCGVPCLVGEVRERLIFSGKMYRFRARRAVILNEYLLLFLRSTDVQASINAMKTGSSESGLNLTQDRFRTLQVTFGSLAEQHRIIAEIDQVMGLCDELAAAQEESARSRDRFALSTLAKINEPNPETFVNDARFALANLAPLTSRAGQIEQLRQTILNLAVRGKLVEQDANDGTFVAFHRERRTSSERSSKSEEITDVFASSIDPPFNAPEGWVWTNVQNILDPSREISYGVIKLGDEPKTGGVLTLRCSDVRPGFIDLSSVRKVSEKIEADYLRTRLLGGEVVINIRGTLGGVALVPDTLRGFNVAREVAVVPVAHTVSGQFIVYLMLSPYFWDHIQNNLRGIAYKGLNLGILRELPIPVPPLPEQVRIVAKVGELMALCDRLEHSLDDSERVRSKLLESLLHRALEPVPG